MGLSQQQLDRVSQAYAELVQTHPELRQKKSGARSFTAVSDHDDKQKKWRAIVQEALPTQPEAAVEERVDELVALIEGRPSILIRDNDYSLEDHANLPNVLRDLLRGNRAAVRRAIRGVGRIEVTNHPQRAWLGTGFIVQASSGVDVVVTNRHVAVEMARRAPDGGYRFIDGLLGTSPVAASLDLKEEVDSARDDTSFAIQIAEVIHIEDDPGPDLAFLRLGTSTALSEIARLQLYEAPDANTPIAAIGYPAKDTRGTDLDTVLALLGDVYDKKRLAPGVLKAVIAHEVEHDCSTLGGNSGSAIIDLRSGQVVGLHAGGVFPGPRNFGVSSRFVQERLQTVLRTGPLVAGTAFPVAATVVQREGQQQGTPMNASDDSSGWHRSTVSLELPLRITVEVGRPQMLAAATGGQDGMQVSLAAAVDEMRQAFGGRSGVVRIRAGLAIVNQHLTDDPAIVVLVDHSQPGSDEIAAQLPTRFHGLPVQIRAASAEDLWRADHPGVQLEG
ncbi:MAG: trypsin-like serine peptidase, partial [Geminicoccaceae bacterium]